MPTTLEEIRKAALPYLSPDSVEKAVNAGKTSPFPAQTEQTVQVSDEELAALIMAEEGATDVFAVDLEMTAEESQKMAQDIIDATPTAQNSKRVTPKIEKKEYKEIEVEKLVHYPAQPFQLYKQERLQELADSIAASGVTNPIIVTPEKGGARYLILSGHNRTDAAKLAGLKTIPAVIYYGLSSAQQKLILVESNLYQRAASEMLPSEKGYAYKMELEALKALGKSTAKSQQVFNIQQADKDSFRGPANPHGSKAERSDFRSEIGGILDTITAKHDKDYNEIYRLIRLTFLVPELQDKVDANKLPLTVAVSLSYIRAQWQSEIHSMLEAGKRIDGEKAEALKSYDKRKLLTAETARQILDGELVPRSKKPKATGITLKPKILQSYFAPGTDSKTVTQEIQTSLALTKQLLPQLMEKHGIAEEDPIDFVQRALMVYFDMKQR